MKARNLYLNFCTSMILDTNLIVTKTWSSVENLLAYVQPRVCGSNCRDTETVRKISLIRLKILANAEHRSNFGTRGAGRGSCSSEDLGKKPCRTCSVFLPKH